MLNNTFIKGNPDKRLVQRLRLKGEISEADLQNYLSSLPDLAENAEEIEISAEECRQNGAEEDK